MIKVLLPLGLLTGAIAATSLTTSNRLPSPTVTLAQSASDQPRVSPTGNMTQAKLEDILREMAETVEVNQNQVLFTIEDQSLLLITDATANRMRLLSPIVRVDDLSGEDMAKMMIANFHTALDGRYAISNGIVYAAFIHPLSSLEANDFRSAVAQVVSLTQTYGSTYSSGSDLFGAPGPAETTDSLPAI